VKGGLGLRHRFAASAPEWVRRVARAVVARARGAARDDASAKGSFGNLVASREAWLFEHLPPDAAAYQYDIFTKTSQKRLARRLGLRVADDHVVDAPLADAIAHVEAHDLESFVIKPNLAHSARGCRGVLRVDGGRYRDLRTLREWTLPELEDDVRRDVASMGRPDEWVVEELLLPVDGSPAAIEDYKIYCFGAKAELIAHKRPIEGTTEYFIQIFTRDWSPVNVGLADRDEGEERAPVNGARLVEVAERAAGRLAYPFIRIDLYDTTKGIVLGEFTPGPGRRYDFNAEWDERLTRLWHEAAAELKEGIRTGRITPLGPE
jgi:hypothetical protein